MAYGDNFNITLPTDGQADWGEGALNDVLDAIIAVIEQKVTAAGIDLQGDLAFAGNGASDLGSVAFRNVSANPPTRGLSFKANELWVSDGLGNSFAITSNGAVNAGDGSITGLAGSNGSAAYSDPRFTFLASDVGAEIEAGPVRIRKPGSAVVTELNTSTSLAADLELTFPSGSIAGGTGLMTMTSAGQMGVTKDPSVNTVTVAGSGSFTGPLTSTAILNAVSIALTGSMRTSGNTHMTGAAYFTGSLQMKGERFEVNAPTYLNGNVARTTITGTLITSGSHCFVAKKLIFPAYPHSYTAPGGLHTTSVGQGTSAIGYGVRRDAQTLIFAHRIDGLVEGDRIQKFGFSCTKKLGSSITGTLGYISPVGALHNIIDKAANAAATTGQVFETSTLTSSIFVTGTHHYVVTMDMRDMSSDGADDTIWTVLVSVDRPEA